MSSVSYKKPFRCLGMISVTTLLGKGEHTDSVLKGNNLIPRPVICHLSPKIARLAYTIPYDKLSLARYLSYSIVGHFGSNLF